MNSHVIGSEKVNKAMSNATQRNNAIYARRRFVNGFNMLAATLAMGFGLFWLFWILWTLIQHGLSGLSADVFTQVTPPPGSAGGLANAIAGSLQMTFFGIVFGTPIGILAGVYLAEYGERGWLAPATRFINDILLSAPSIVIGLFIYEVYVISVGAFLWLGRLVRAGPAGDSGCGTHHREHAAPGTQQPARSRHRPGRPAVEVIMLVTLRAAKAGVVTGILLAVARISGETAPLLFTAPEQPVLEQYEPADGQPADRHLPVRDEPVRRLARPGWAGALLITFSVLTLNIVARWLASKNNQSH